MRQPPVSTPRLGRHHGFPVVRCVLFGVSFVALNIAALGAWNNDDTPAPIEVGTLDMDLSALEHTTPPVAQPIPTNLRIASIDVDSPLVDLHLDEAGALGVPSDFGVVGWWSEGVVPGGPGPAVVVGHVDSATGPAVFYRLRDLAVGDPIEVARADGSVVTFAVEAIRQYPKSALPTELVYGPTPTPALRLITCGGEFDEASRHYRDNVVVFAVLAPPTPVPT